MTEILKAVELIEDKRQDNQADWKRGNRKKILYKQFAIRCGAVC